MTKMIYHFVENLRMDKFLRTFPEPLKIWCVFSRNFAQNRVLRENAGKLVCAKICANKMDSIQMKNCILS